MKEIELDNWVRRDQYERFRKYTDPYFNLCANMDLTDFLPAVKSRNVSFTAAFVFVLTQSANMIPEFRYRLRENAVIEHEVIHPAITVLLDDDTFSFCFFKYEQTFALFAKGVRESIDNVKRNPSVANPYEDDWLYMTAIPWVSFTSFKHPMDLSCPHSVPLIAWGKFLEDGEKTLMPLSVQGHHALMDGFHMGKYYTLVQKALDNPDDFLG